MRLRIQGRHLRVSQRLKDYIEKKIGKLEHYLPSLDQARVELKREKTRDAAQSQVVEVTLWSNGHILRGEERAADFNAAVDTVMEKLYKQIEHWKGKHHRSRTHPSPAESLETVSGQIVKRKRFVTRAMSEENAIDQMEGLGHSFFLFVNEATDELNLLYRRDDRNYGLIAPRVEPRK